MTTKTFTIAGVSSSDGNTKIRFANDLATRVKVLMKCGDDDIDLRELPEPMMKPDAMTYLMSVRESFTPAGAITIEDANDKYNPKPKAKRLPKTPKTKKVTAKAGEVTVTSTTSKTEVDSEKDKRNARRRELRALKKAAAEAEMAENAEAE